MRLGRVIGLVLAAAALVAVAGVIRIDGAESRPPEPPPTTVAPPPTTTTTVPPTTTTAPAPPERLTLAFTGDLLPHTSVLEQAAAYGAPHGAQYDFRPMFTDVEPLLAAADLAICHLEVPLSADNALIASYPSFSSPKELGRAIAAAGYDACSTASNHTLDQRSEGVVATLDVLDRNAVDHAGSYRTEEAAATPVLYEAGNGLTVGHVSAAYGFNGYTPDTPWRVGTLDPNTLVARGRAAREAGADLVVASLHWGVESQHDPTADQLALAETLTASGAFDLIVGHHAHVVQPVRRFHGVPVVFGLGNFLSNMTDPEERDGVIAEVNATRPAGETAWRFDIGITPTWVDPSSFTIRPTAESVNRPDLAAVAGELRASWQRTISVMTATGIAHPTRPLPP